MPDRSLEPFIMSEGQIVNINPWGVTHVFRSDFLEGEIFFAHQPPPGSGIPFEYQHRLASKGYPDWTFEIQLQGKFSTIPRDPLWIACELRDVPMRLGLASRTLCRVILKFLKMQAHKRNIELRYSFGDSHGERPTIMFPVHAIDRIWQADHPMSLPLGHNDESAGTWRYDGAQWNPIERQAVVFDTSVYTTMAFATCYCDWSTWSLINLPGLGSLNLEHFWGEQPMWVTICDEDSAQKQKRYLVEIALTAPIRAAPARTEKRDEAHLTQEVTDTVVELADAEVEAESQEQQRLSYQEPPDTDHPPSPPGSSAGPVLSRVYEEEDNAEKDRSPPTDYRKVTSSTPLRDSSVIDKIESDLENVSDAVLYRHIEVGAEDQVLPPSLPWYFRAGSGAMWWCIKIQGRLCWRHHRQLQALCVALAKTPEEAHFGHKGSVQDFECTRRTAARLLTVAQGVPGLFDEFMRMEVELPSLIRQDATSSLVRGAWLGVVEAEGRIVERYVQLGDSLRWQVNEPSCVKVCVELKDSHTYISSVAGAPAIVLTTPHRQFVFVVSSDAEAHRWAASMKGPNTPEWRWQDPLRRWPKNRIVINDTALMEPIEGSALAFSAQLLRKALVAHHHNGGDADSADLQRTVTKESCALKCVNIADLTPQDLWCFWLNVFHCLLLHAQLVCGRPRNLQQLVGFYNNCSYLVAGHAFSLTEIEHCILRAHMTRPRVILLKALLKTWKRTDEDLEMRPCLAAPFAPSTAFRCRPDWRLNLVFSNGGFSTTDAIPVFDHLPKKEFDDLVARAMARTLAVLSGSAESGWPSAPVDFDFGAVARTLTAVSRLPREHRSCRRSSDSESASSPPGDTAGGDVTAGRGGAGPVTRSLNAMGLSFPTMDSQNNPDATTFGGQGARALDMVRSFGDKYRAEDPHNWVPERAYEMVQRFSDRCRGSSPSPRALTESDSSAPVSSSLPTTGSPRQSAHVQCSSASSPAVTSIPAILRRLWDASQGSTAEANDGGRSSSDEDVAVPAVPNCVLDVGGATAAALPWVLYRFRDDAPPGAPGEGHAKRWAKALAPLGLRDGPKPGYRRQYNWALRTSMTAL